MGLLRFLLALAVVLNHAGGLFRYQITGAIPAVQTFYVISGFLMALVLHTKYRPVEDRYIFWTNRALRIYVVYWVALLFAVSIGCVVWLAAGGGFIQVWKDAGNTWLGYQKIAFAFSQLFIFGHDLFLFGHLEKTAGFVFDAHQNLDPALIYAAPIPPAWSIALELTFYVFVPFLARMSTPMLISIFAASLGLRIVAGLAGLTADPWSYRFFPFELGLFVLGMISYRLNLFAKLSRARQVTLFAMLIAATLALQPIYVGLRSLGVTEYVPRWLYYFAIAASLPAITALTSSSAFDKQVGNLSYPLYLIHFPVVVAVGQLSGGWFQRNSVLFPISCVAVSLLMAWVIAVAVEVPLDAYRHRRLSKR